MGTDISPDQYNILQYLNGFATLLSILGESYLLYFFLRESKNRNFPLNLILGLVLSDTLYSISNLLTYFQEYDALCTIQGFLREFSLNSELMWSMTIIIFSYHYVSQTNNRLDKIFTIFLPINLVISLALPLAVLIIQLFGGSISYSLQYNFCDYSPELPNLIFSELPMVIIVSISCSYSYKVFVLLKNKTRLIEYSLKILAYPVVSLVLVMPILINRLTNFFTGEAIFGLVFIQILCLRLGGFLNALVFGANRLFIEDLTNPQRTLSSELPVKISVLDESNDRSKTIVKSVNNDQLLGSEILGY